MIAESPALNPDDDFYAPEQPFFMETTSRAFGDAGFAVSRPGDLLGLGVYLTTAVKCAKTGTSVPTAAIRECSHLLESELALFPHLAVILAMGDVAIKAINAIGRRTAGRRVIPAGSTYKLRDAEYSWNGIRVFPSYLPTGKSYLIEKSKQKMIAEDIRAALHLIGASPES